MNKEDQRLLHRWNDSEKRRVHNSIWTQLPKEIIWLILEHLSMVDYMRLAAVCTRWRSIVAENFHNSPLVFHWIMLSFNPRNSIRGFFSLSDGKEYKLNLPEARGARCCGSLQDWMIMRHKEQGNFLLNPFSRVQIQLPNFFTRYNKPKCDLDHIRKAILSAVPTPTNMKERNCLVVAICGCFKLVFCRPGDETWTTLGKPYYDTTFYKGLLYALNRNEVMVWELSPPVVCNNILPPVGVESFHFWSVSLVESRGELMMVMEVPGMSFAQKIRFKLFKLDPNASNWLVVESLGDSSLFLGSTYSGSHFAMSSISVKVTTNLLALGFRQNCIYFSQGSTACGTYARSCTFQLDEKIAEDLPSIYRSFQFTPIWVTLNPL